MNSVAVGASPVCGPATPRWQQERRAVGADSSACWTTWSTPACTRDGASIQHQPGGSAKLRLQANVASERAREFIAHPRDGAAPPPRGRRGVQTFVLRSRRVSGSPGARSCVARLHYTRPCRAKGNRYNPLSRPLPGYLHAWGGRSLPRTWAVIRRYRRQRRRPWQPRASVPPGGFSATDRAG